MKFHTDSPVFEFLGTLLDFVLLNFIFLLTCIPIITIGPSLSALFTVTMKEVREEGGSMIRSYLKAWKDNFIQSLALFLIYVILGAILLYNYVFWLNLSNRFSSLALAIVSFAALLYIFSLVYVFALNARFENRIRQTIKNALLLAVTHMRQTLCLCLILLISSALFYVSRLFGIFLLIFGFSFLAYLASFPLQSVFLEYEPGNEEENSTINTL